MLSKYPLYSPIRIQHSQYLDGGGYASLLVSSTIEGHRFHFTSTRLTAWDSAENIFSHEQLRITINALPMDEPLILGGDFNTKYPQTSNNGPSSPYTDFLTRSSLHNVVDGIGWNSSSIDHIFARGPLVFSGRRSTDTRPSDHNYVFAEVDYSQAIDLPGGRRS